jgi:hypothetical protein
MGGTLTWRPPFDKKFFQFSKRRLGDVDMWSDARQVKSHRADRRS